MRGTFYGIGVGPGDPELLTVKAIKAIEAADVLIAPKTEKKEGSVALEIARPYLKKDIEIVYQVFPMVKDFAEDTGAWEANKAEILALLNEGKNVAFLTLGDPMFFSTYIYVFRLLEHEDVDIVTIPGVPAFIAIGSYVGRPIVEGNDVLAIIPGTADKKRLDAVMKELTQSLRRCRKIVVNFESPKEALVQAILARGDRRLAEPLIRAAEGRGAKELVGEMRAEGLSPDDYLTREWGADTPLPWDHLDMGFPKRYLWQEYERAAALKATVGCFDGCMRCGVCGTKRERTSE